MQAIVEHARHWDGLANKCVIDSRHSETTRSERRNPCDTELGAVIFAEGSWLERHNSE
jgi:hypothetical protein